MPMPKPRSGESQSDFITRCMGNETMKSEYSEQDQRNAVCSSQWEGPKENLAHNFESITFKQNVSIPVRAEMHEGREHLVIPIVLMVEGVHHGSGGPMFYPMDAISHNFQTWNGMPVPILHPTNSAGIPVSCNDPGIIERQNVGRLYNVHIDSGKLKGEAWIDVSKANKIDPLLLPAIKNGIQVEVSTGVYTFDDMTSGEWNGEAYNGIIRDIRPDHLALLPGLEGACSWEDGCGVRLNKKGGEQLDELDKVKTEEEVKAIGQALLQADPDKRTWLKGRLVGLARFFGFRISEVSDSELRQKLQIEVDKLDKPPEPASGIFHYVRDVFGNDGYFIYEIRGGDGTDNKLFKQKFELSDAGEIKMKGKASEVTEETRYIAAMAVNGIKQDIKKEGQNDMEETRKQKVDALIANERSTYDEGDRQWLEGLDDNSFTSLEGVNEKYDAKWNEFETKLTAIDDKKKAEDEEAKAKAKAVAATKTNEEAKTVEEFIANAPSEIGEVLQESMEMRSNRKDELIKAITANAVNPFTEDELKTKGLPELEKLAKMANIDFSGQSGGITTRVDEVKIHERQSDGSGVPEMPKMEFGK